MNIQRLYPGPVENVDLEDRERLLELYRPPSETWLRLNLITSVTGAASGSDGTSETLTNPADRRLLGVIRELADVVLIGAESVRAEGYQQPRRSRIAILTASGNLAGNRIVRADGPSPIVICPPEAVALVNSTLEDAELIVLTTERDRIGVSAAVAALRSRGLTSIVCEGGPGLAAQVLDAGLVDEFCLATSPRIGGAPFPVLGGSAITEHTVELTQLLRDESSGLYARWLLLKGA